ncbi:MAG: hypothetical protein KKC85_01935, partial [Gammaproteobacteria bacterium]|nr:hypothetical protein [Gammaproteobacteria bacterium]
MDDPALDPFPPASVALSPANRPWTRMPYEDAPHFEARTLAAHWDRLHAGQGLQPPAPGPLAEGWAAYHSGDFERAADIGLQHGREGQALADQATAIYADYLEPRETVRLSLFKTVFERAAALSTREPDNCHALFWQAYVLGRYSQ